MSERAGTAVLDNLYEVYFVAVSWSSDGRFRNQVS